MIITPAVFEDEMKKAKTVQKGFALMMMTLQTLGYEAGIMEFLNKHGAEDHAGEDK